MNVEQDELLTVRESSRALSCGVTKTYEYMSIGISMPSGDGLEIVKLESIKLGKLRRIPRSYLNKFIAKLLVCSSEAEKLEV
jgi:hypothetical protein